MSKPTPEEIEQVKQAWADEINEAIESGDPRKLKKVKIDLEGPLFKSLGSKTNRQRLSYLMKRFFKS